MRYYSTYGISGVLPQFKRAVVSPQAQMMQIINLSLMNRLRQGPEKLFQQLIHQQEVNIDFQPDDLLRLMISLGKSRGLSLTKTNEELYRLFQKNLQVQRAFEAEQFSLLPLSHPQDITCIYFRNKNGLFYGVFQPYLTCMSDDVVLDHTNYWGEWEQHLPQ